MIGRYGVDLREPKTHVEEQFSVFEQRSYYSVLWPVSAFLRGFLNNYISNNWAESGHIYP